MIELPQQKKFKVILADPPWSYQDSGCNGNAQSHYNTMSLKNICKLPINKLADEDCVLFMWVTYPLLPEALKVIESWGFKFKSIAFQWVKLNKKNGKPFYGLGRWTRGNTEPCFIATKGKPKRKANDVFQLIQSPIRKHSQKPVEQYELIERLMGDVPRIELFARTKRQGWDCWGNEIDENTPTQTLLSQSLTGEHNKDSE